MDKPTLLVLAAGMGSRFGGLKQIEPLGPNGEIIIDYSLYDAYRAGFGKVVFVIKKELEDTFREVIGSRAEKLMKVEYAFQDTSMLPEGFICPEVMPYGARVMSSTGPSALSTPMIFTAGTLMPASASF